MKKKKKIFVADFETTVFDGQIRTDVWAAALVEIGSEDVEIFHTIGEFISRLIEEPGNIKVYFHNLSFDGAFILSYLLGELKIPQALDSEEHFLKPKEMPTWSVRYTISAKMNNWYAVTFKTDHNVIEFWDSLKLLPFSVAAIGKNFKTKHRKLDMEYEGDRFPGCEITPEEQEYIKNDVLVVAEALQAMFDNGLDKMTIGACCLSEFKALTDEYDYRGYFPNLKKTHPINPAIYKYENAEEYIRRAYRGGWCYCVEEKAGKKTGPGCVYDVNSLYPSMMESESGNRYPVGHPRFWHGNFIPDKAKEKDRYYFIRVKTRFYLKQGYLPFMQIKGDLYYDGTENLKSSDYRDKNGIYHRYTIDKETGERIEMIPELVLTMTDWELLKEHYILQDTEILDGCYFNTEIGIFDIYIQKYRKMKIENNDNPVLRQIAKLMLNNLYGKLATSTDSSFKIAYIDENGVLKFTTVLCNDKDPVYIPCGAAITSYARNFTIRAAQKNYYGPNKPGFCYADTDSIHCDIPADAVKGLRVHPVNFCCWSNENNFDFAVFTRQKTYLEHVTEKDGEPCEPYYNIKCAGMPERCKKLFAARLNGYMDPEDVKKLTSDMYNFVFDENGEIITATPEDFKEGLTVPGKLMRTIIPGGVLLKENVFTLRG